MNNKKMRLPFLVLLLVSIVLTACGDSGSQKKASAEDGLIKSEKIDLGETYSLVHDIQLQQNGKVRIGVSDENGLNSRIFESEDKGQTWEKVAELDSLVEITKNDYTVFDIGSNGEVFIVKVANAPSAEEAMNQPATYHVIGEDKKATELSFELEELTAEDHEGHDHGEEEWEENTLSQFEFTEDGDLLATDSGKHCYYIDGKTGKIKQKYQLLDDFDYAEALHSDDENVYVYSSTGFLVYAKDSGKLVTDTTAEQVISKSLEESANQNTYILTSMHQEAKGKNILFSNAKGIYQFDGKKAVQKMDLSLLDIGLTQNYARFLTLLDDSQFLMAVTNFEEGSDAVYLSQKYTGEEAEKKKAAKTTLTIWSLQETPELQAVVDSFKAKNSDVDLDIQIGLDGEGAANVSDAISNLNTKLLAKEGPDVLFLDGLPINSYIEKDMLLDLQETYNQLKTEEELFENVASAYQTKDGMFAIPQGFAYMAVTSKKDLLDQAASTENLLKLLEKETKLKLGVEDAKQLTSILYYSSINDWFDGETIDKAALETFFQQYKEVYEAAKNNLYEKDSIDFTQSERAFFSGNFYTLEITEDEKTDIALDYIGLSHSAYALETLTQLDYQSTLFNQGEAKQFLPVGILGISSNSQQEDLAKEFVKFMLSKDGGTMDGIPVNKTQFSNNSHMESPDFEGTQLLTDQQNQTLIERLDGLDTLVDLNGVISETVVEQLEAYVLEGESLETTVTNAIKKVDLYMSE